MQDSCYIEPFAGMAGVLLARQPIKREVVNDLNRRIVNWWQAVRDEPEEFGRLIDAMPASRVEYEWAVRNMDNPELPPIRRALAFHVAVEQSVLHADNTPSVSWSRTFAPQVGFKPRVRAWDIAALADRLRYVQLECVDACDLLERVRDCDYAVIYADPPYPTANTSPYHIDTLNIGRCAELLAAQRGAVAVSGYGDEWDVLGWRRVERPGLSRAHTGGLATDRMEVLWLNDKASATRPGLFG